MVPLNIQEITIFWMLKEEKDGIRWKWGVVGSTKFQISTDEELLYYYLKNVSYEPIDFDVIRDVNLNKLEPWDLKGINVIAEGRSWPCRVMWCRIS